MAPLEGQERVVRGALSGTSSDVAGPSCLYERLSGLRASAAQPTTQAEAKPSEGMRVKLWG